jgi:hypothetical protein
MAIAIMLPPNRRKGSLNHRGGIAGIMVNRLQSVALRVVIACAMALSLMLAPPTGSMSHNPFTVAQAEAERHQALSAEIAEHGHFHDDGWSDEAHSGHLHGHDASDHLHDTPGDPPATPSMLVAASESWDVASFYDIPPLQIFELDRPPRA